MNLALSANTVWVGVGLVGQMLFSGRFFVQWIASEKARKSIIPNAFWYLSIAGGIVLFTYACWRQDPVFIIGQGMGIFVYARNVYLLHVVQGRTGEQ
jgi:lipid-A-disaccharide synthase-like uncharacterized protein